MEKTELARRIREAAYLEGDFTLRSGRKSNYYLDKYLFETQPDILHELGRAFAKYATDSTTTSPATRGSPSPSADSRCSGSGGEVQTVLV